LTFDKPKHEGSGRRFKNVAAEPPTEPPTDDNDV